MAKQDKIISEYKDYDDKMCIRDSSIGVKPSSKILFGNKK